MEGQGSAEGSHETRGGLLALQVALVALAAALGFIGWMVLLGSSTYADYEPYADFWWRLSEAASGTLGLFAASFSVPPIPLDAAVPTDESEMVVVPWNLQVARFLAPFSVFFLVVWVVFNSFVGDSLRLWVTSLGLRSKSGLIICGGGELVENVAIQESIRAGRRPGLRAPWRYLNALKVISVQQANRGSRKGKDGSAEYWPIVLVSELRPQRLSELKSLGVRWIPADPRQQDVLEAMKLYKAAAIVALDEDVSWNTDVALRAERVAGEKAVTKTHVVARAGRSPEVPWKTGVGTKAVTVTPTDFDDIAARAILEEVDPFPGLDRGISQGDRVLVVATDEPVGDSLIIEGIRLWAARNPPLETMLCSRSDDLRRKKGWASDRLRVLLVGREAERRVERIIRLEPEIVDLLDPGHKDGAGPTRPPIAGWDRAPEAIGEDPEWFAFEKGREYAAIGPREEPTVVVHTMNRHQALRAARDVGSLPGMLSRNARVVAVTESGQLDEHLSDAEGFRTIDLGTLLANVSLYIDGGFTQRLAKSLHVRWAQRGARSTVVTEEGTPEKTPFFRGMLKSWEELSEEEEACWVRLSEYLLEGRDPVNRKLDALRPWEREGLGFVVAGAMEELEQGPRAKADNNLGWIDELQLSRHPDLVVGAFLDSGISLKANEWASSLSHALWDARGDSLNASAQWVSTAYRQATATFHTPDSAAPRHLIEAVVKSEQCARTEAQEDSGQLAADETRAFEFVHRSLKQIRDVREAED